MIVVGGSYTETVLYPKFATTFVGSGLRAAATLGEHVDELVTVATSTEEDSVRAAVSARTTVSVSRREQPVEFRYVEASLRPHVSGLPATPSVSLKTDFSGQDVLAFGMAEFPYGYPLMADRLVLDPQSPQIACTTMLTGITAGSIAICANRAEARRMTGHDSPIDAADALLALPNVDAVVVKCGALGYVTADRTVTEWSHATPTLAIRALGTGDVFSSVFAREWFAGTGLSEAAATAGAAVAQDTGAADTAVDASALRLQPGYAPKIYLAGPFFTLSERWLVERVRAALSGLGARVFSPIHDVGPGGIEVALKDLDGLDSCDAVLALLDGFDPGTIYETGWAARENIPVVGFSSETHPKESKMLVGMGAEIHTDLTTAMYRVVWAGLGLTLSPGIHDGAHHG